MINLEKFPFSILRSGIFLSSLLDGSLFDIINSTFPFEKILNQELLWCLLYMKYLSNEKYVKYIKTLSEKKILEYKNLIDCLKEKTLN